MVFTKDISLSLHFLFRIFSFNKEQERFTIFLPIMFKPQTEITPRHRYDLRKGCTNINPEEEKEDSIVILQLVPRDIRGRG